MFCQVEKVNLFHVHQYNVDNFLILILLEYRTVPESRVQHKFNVRERILLHYTIIDFNFGLHKDLSTQKSDNSPRPLGRGEYHF